MPNFLIRSAKPEDVNDYYRLSKTGRFFNLPENKNKITDLLVQSEESFQNDQLDKEKAFYYFSLVNQESGQVVGCSMIHAKHGTPSAPHFCFKLRKEKREYAPKGIVREHLVLSLGTSVEGYTEIGGLVVDPSLRGQRLGSFLSFSRFIYMGLCSSRFMPKVHVELMPKFDKEGSNDFWEKFARQFIPLDYDSADRLSFEDKNLITDLIPKADIYSTLLPDEVIALIGEVSDKARPVQSILEKIGFEFTDEIDPFDGGPHYRCSLFEVDLIKNLKKFSKMQDFDSSYQECDTSGLTGFVDKFGNYTCLRGEFKEIQSVAGKLGIDDLETGGIIGSKFL